MNLFKKSPTNKSYICVDPEEKLLEYGPKSDNFEFLVMDGLSFSKLDRRYNKMLMIQMIHHFPLEDFHESFVNFHKQLEEGGEILIQTRLKYPDYPFFEKANKIWSEEQEDYKTICSRIEKAGFKVDVIFFDYQVKMTKEEWFNLIRIKFWSVFSFFTDPQLEEGINELRLRFANTDIIEFVDRSVIIQAKKN